ncbi:WapI family immunity protein [Mucilaginibacter celer]|uniref:Uncharacterized protein n=1 Tax=Mucilaginibacter celer TaxID=2305508 RepID=A0A494VTF9_9SPHI|nr:hypothetical protein [Mucilaginibacter celer]AYL94232.1 hypothetical protein HYN43_002500 [Mucilaginibacter celer]
MKKKSPLYFEITDAYDIVRVTVKGPTKKSTKVVNNKGWLDIDITVKGCTLGGSYHAEFLPISFHSFRQQLVSLMYGLDKTAAFDGVMGYLKLEFEVKYEGFAEIKVRACDVPGIGSELTFKMSIQLSDVNELVLQLDSILSRYPLLN